jgi:hypothetical protein
LESKGHKVGIREQPLTPSERRRRVLITCCNFVRSLAVFQTGRCEGRALLADNAAHASFWRQIDSNAIDVCVLEWCKLFGDTRGKHYWKRVISEVNHNEFHGILLTELAMTQNGYDSFVMKMRSYRDRFVAHLDDDRTMDIPELESTKISISSLYSFLATRECDPADFGILARTRAEFETGYDQCVQVVRQVIQIEIAQ